MSEITESTIVLLKNKRNKLESDKSIAVRDGNIEILPELESKIQEVDNILNLLEQ